jgi:L-cysteine desulfidase
MDRESACYEACLRVLREELVPAMGCTEPVAIAYCAAVARRALGEAPVEVEARLSGNVIKNVKSVTVPGTGGLKGIAAALAAGIVAGDPDKKLEVIAGLDDFKRAEIRAFIEKVPIRVRASGTRRSLEVTVTVRGEKSRATASVADKHTRLIRLEVNGEALIQEESPEEGGASAPSDPLTMEGIHEFATGACLEDVEELLDRQIEMNTRIAEEGLSGEWGAGIGKVLMNSGEDLPTRAKAMAAAGSDARMGGCALPVVINAGSGNQGLTVSLPVITYARAMGASRESLYRALILSNLISIHQRHGMGRLGAFCGAVCAGAAAGAGITYLKGGGYGEICRTVVNALAITSGIVCDGAKPSCAAKIAASVDAGLLGGRMVESGKGFAAGEGIVSADIEDTLQNVARIGKDGMRQTDREIIRIMVV